MADDDFTPKGCFTPQADFTPLVDATKKAAGTLTGSTVIKALSDALTSKGASPAPAPPAGGPSPSPAQLYTTGAAIGPTVKTVGEPVQTAPMKQNFSEYQE